MCKMAVIYQSKYGSAKRYAQWIAQETGADLLERSKITIEDLRPYDIIVYGGALYAVGILGLSLVRDHFDKLKGKKVIVFSVGASPAHLGALEDIKAHNFTAEMKKEVPYFHLRGAFDFGKLSVPDKVLMWLMKIKLKSIKQEKRTPDEKGMLACYERSADWTDKKAIEPILECINFLRNRKTV